MANNWIFSDGGRAQSGFNGMVGDCVIRAIAIATKLDYSIVWNDLNDRSIDAYNKTHAKPTNKPLVDNGVYPYIYHPYLKELGWSYTSVNKDIRPSDLPNTGIVIVHTRAHLFCMINGVIQDTFNSFQRVRYVWGYFTLPASKAMPVVNRPSVNRYHMSQQYLTSLNARSNKPIDLLYTVDQPNEHNTSLNYALEYWRDRAYTFTMLWGRERYTNPYSQISLKFADKLNMYHQFKIQAESELARLFALKPYVSPLMEYVSILILITALINQSIEEQSAMNTTQYTIKASKRLPVTVINPSKGTNRVVVYKRVKIARVQLGSAIGLRYGFIQLGGVTRIVKSRTLSNGEFSQWELI